MAHNLADLYEHAADAFGTSRTAVVEGERELSFADLDAEANRWADALAGLGIGAGGRVGIEMRNGIDCIAAMLGVLKLRAVPVSINFRYVGGELAYLLSYAETEVVVFGREFGAALADVATGVDSVTHTIVVEDGSANEVVPAGALDAAELLASASPERPEIERSADDIFLVFTGGTTGKPKGVVWRHEDLWRSLGGGSDYYTLEPAADEYTQAQNGALGDPVRSLVLLPLIHTSGLMPSLTQLFGGSTIYFIPQFDSAEVWRQIERHRVQVAIVAGDAMIRPMVDRLRAVPVDVSSLFMVSSGAAVFSPALKKELFELHPDLMIMDAFGSSESGFGGLGTTTKANADDGSLFESHGPRIPRGDTMFLVDDFEVKLADDSQDTGWIIKRGYLPSGYLGDPVKSAETFRTLDGERVVFTGDRGKYDGNGNILLLGRASQVINSGGEKIFAEEVETALKSLGAIADAVVLGIPDDRFGHRVGAIVQAADSGDPIDFAVIETGLRAHLAGYKIPAAFWQVDVVERHPSSKTDYAWARHMVAETPPTLDRRTPAA